jgi:hypothetical protein
MRWADLPNGLIAAVWAYLLVSGLDGIRAIQERHLPDYPATDQWVLYVGLPALFVSLAMLAALAARKTRWFYDLYPFAVCFIGFCVFPILMFWGGGV